MFDSTCRVVVFSDHLDGIAKKGAAKYLSTIRGISGTAYTMAIPAVEVTCGYDYAAYDVIALGLTDDSLGELVSLYNRGAFHDPETGLPALKSVAEKYHLTLIAAHPDSKGFLTLKGIPFHLGENSKYVNGFEAFDSNHIGFDADKFIENCRQFYNHTNQVIIPAGSDFHFGLHGPLPTTSWKESPVTMVILDDGVELTEQSVIDAFRDGQVYATSILGGRLAVSNVIPGETWDRESNLIMACDGINEGDLLYEQINVICASQTKWYTRSYYPQYQDGMLVLNLQDYMIPDDVTSLNVDFGGRLLTSTIFVEPAVQVTASNTTVVEAPEVAAPAQPAQGVQPPTQPIDFTVYKHHYRWTHRHGIGLAEWELGVNDDFRGKVRFCPLAGFPDIIRDVEGLKLDGGLYGAYIPYAYDQTLITDIENDMRSLGGGPPTLRRKVRFYTGEWKAPLGTVSPAYMYVDVAPDFKYVSCTAFDLIGVRYDSMYLDGYAKHFCNSYSLSPRKN